MKYDPNKHHRRSIRLQGYDYSQAGFYFLTICVQNRACLLGEIQRDQMQLNPAGEMINKWGLTLPDKFPSVAINASVIMPNHFHGIIIITHPPVGADPRVCPPNINTNHLVGTDPRVCPPNINAPNIDCPWDQGQGAHVGAPLPEIVQWFKTMTTNEYIRGVKNLGWQPFNKRLWQRNYYEHIIRNEESLRRIQEYIYTNPLKWTEDQLHPNIISNW